jgi:hypothetical protein
MTEGTGGRRYCNCQWAQEDVETLYSLLNNNNDVGKKIPIYIVQAGSKAFSQTSACLYFQVSFACRPTHMST